MEPRLKLAGVTEHEHLPSNRLIVFFPREAHINAQWKTSGHKESAKNAARVLVKSHY